MGNKWQRQRQKKDNGKRGVCESESGTREREREMLQHNKSTNCFLSFRRSIDTPKIIKWKPPRKTRFPHSQSISNFFFFVSLPHFYALRSKSKPFETMVFLMMDIESAVGDGDGKTRKIRNNISFIEQSVTHTAWRRWWTANDKGDSDPNLITFFSLFSSHAEP